MTPSTITRTPMMPRYSLVRHDLLTADEEVSLARRWLHHQDYRARERLVESHMRLVAKIATGYRGYGLDHHDMVGEGVLGLLRAIDGFNPELGFRLSTYAMWWIKASMTEYILNNWSIVRTGSASGRKKLFFGLRSLKKKLQLSDNGDLAPQEVGRVASTMGVSHADVIDMNRRLSGSDVSLHKPVGEHGDQQYMDIFPSDDAPLEETVIEHLDKEKKMNLLKKAMTELNERERRILTERQMKDEPTTLQTLARDYGISRERVRQIEAGALRKIKKLMNNTIQAIKQQEFGHA